MERPEAQPLFIFNYQARALQGVLKITIDESCIHFERTHQTLGEIKIKLG